MRGHYASAITHITSGLKILAEIRRNTLNTFTNPDLNRQPYIPIDVLCGLFTRLQSQAIVVRMPYHKHFFVLYQVMGLINCVTDRATYGLRPIEHLA